jgi:hypothetical protein
MAAGPPRRPPSPAEPAVDTEPDRAEIRSGAGGAAEVPRGEGDDQGDNNCPPGADEEEDGDDAGEEDDAYEADDAIGPQAFTAGWCEARRGRRIPPRFEISHRFDPSIPGRVPGQVCGTSPALRFRERVRR